MKVVLRGTLIHAQLQAATGVTHSSLCFRPAEASLDAGLYLLLEMPLILTGRVTHQVKSLVPVALLNAAVAG